MLTALRSTNARLILIAAALLGLAYREIFTISIYSEMKSAADTFFYDNASTSPVIAIGLFLFLTVRRMDMLRHNPPAPGPSFYGLGFLPPLVLMSWAYYVHAPDLLACSLFLFVMAAGYILGGGRGVASLVLPSLVLFFAFPQPAVLNNHLIYPMQLWSAQWSTALLHIFGFEAFLSSDQIVMTERILQVIESCSGLRTIQTLTLAAIAYAELFLLGRIHSLILIFSAPLIGFFLNGFRILSIGADPESQIGESHTLQGILVIIGGVLLIAGEEALLRRYLPIPEQGHQEKPARDNEPVSHLKVIRILIVSAALFTIASYLTPRWELDTDPMFQVKNLPTKVGDWNGTNKKMQSVFLGSISQDKYYNRLYERRKDQVHAYIAWDKRASRYRSMLSEKNSLPGTGWVIKDLDQINLDVGSVNIGVMLAEAGQHSSLTYYWYLGVHNPEYEILRSLLGLDQSLFRREGTAVAVRLTTQIYPEREGTLKAHKRLRGFVRDLEQTYPDLLTEGF